MIGYVARAFEFTPGYQCHLSGPQFGLVTSLETRSNVYFNKCSTSYCRDPDVHLALDRTIPSGDFIFFFLISLRY
jgi:hypothetical protein